MFFVTRVATNASLELQSVTGTFCPREIQNFPQNWTKFGTIFFREFKTSFVPDSLPIEVAVKFDLIS